jgi:dTDP-4-dehydrorhamnose 3,5-epimerase-like enzyme
MEDTVQNKEIDTKKEGIQEPFNGTLITPFRAFADERGWLMEVFRDDESTHKPKMGYASFTNFGVSRGPHEHINQTDFFVFSGPGDFSMHLWDTRKDSVTFGKYFTIVVGESNPCSVVVPPGVVHGYKCISEKGAYYVNLPNALFAGEGKKEKVDEIRHEHDENSPYRIE